MIQQIMLQYQNKLLQLNKYCNTKLQTLLKKMKAAAKDLSIVDQIITSGKLLQGQKLESTLKEEQSNMNVESSQVGEIVAK